MLTPNEIRQITALMRREVVPATGCTEPAAVALAVAYASSLVDSAPKSIEVLLSANMLKNAMGVGIPGTGTFGSSEPKPSPRLNASRWDSKKGTASTACISRYD